MKIAVILLGLSAVALAQQQRQGRLSATGRNEATTPVPILRQINTVNEDGSYTYGYEGADGSYKVENKAKNGEVTGKYGYYDDVGQLREVEYGASKLGFNPTGTDIKAPQLPDHVNNLRGQDYHDGDDGTYDAARYERPYDHLNFGPAQAQQAQQQQQVVRRTRPRGQKRLNLAPQQQYQQQYQPQQQQYQEQRQNLPQPYTQHQQPQRQNLPQPYTQPQQPQRQHLPQPYTQPQQSYSSINLPGNTFHGHPARNIDINTGSYSVNY